MTNINPSGSEVAEPSRPPHCRDFGRRTRLEVAVANVKPNPAVAPAERSCLADDRLIERSAFLIRLRMRRLRVPHRSAGRGERASAERPPAAGLRRDECQTENVATVVTIDARRDNDRDGDYVAVLAHVRVNSVDP